MVFQRYLLGATIKANKQFLFQSTRLNSCMPLTFAAPSGCLYNEVEVKQVDVPSLSGSFGILPNHVPSLAVLKPGVVSVYEAESNDAKKYFVSSGTVTINDDSSVQIIAEEAHSLDSIDSNEAKSALAEAQSQLVSASSDKDKAEAQIAVDVAEELVKAIS